MSVPNATFNTMDFFNLKIMRTSGHRVTLVYVQRVQAIGPAQRDGRQRERVRGATIKRAVGQVPGVRPPGLCVLETVLEQDTVGRESG